MRLFQEVKRVVPNFETSYVITDLAHALWNGYKKAFPDSKAQRLFCLWHFIKVQLFFILFMNLYFSRPSTIEWRSRSRASIRRKERRSPTRFVL